MQHPQNLYRLPSHSIDNIISGSIGHLKNSRSSLICVHLRSSVFICGKNLTNDDNRQFDDITNV
ncbi:hypothetical protein [Argonema galeatum]|uniref:hypothetical protein n=1 Tax=Argonema galeatum TaxID=2942762 RepID=UPI002012148F|nr:hypothetical protein [Argonema galeatum]MCL1464580.1 hypothetical protein [Argonema galeatum A003/A1]